MKIDLFNSADDFRSAPTSREAFRAISRFTQISGGYRSDHPVPYWVFDDFFIDGIYQDLCSTFREYRSHGLFETLPPAPHRFIRSRAKLKDAPGEEAYDAYISSWPAKATYPLNLFYSREFFNFFQSVFGIDLSPDVVGSFHHHKVGSQSGFVHTDYSTYSFWRAPLKNGINPHWVATPYQEFFDDRPGAVNLSRAIALIYYLDNEPWSAGDGGETTFFADLEGKTVLDRIAPVNNRMLAFEVSPKAFHAFSKNIRFERNSICFWFHSELEYAAKRFGELPPKPPKLPECLRNVPLPFRKKSSE